MVVPNAIQTLEELQTIEVKIKHVELMLQREMSDEELQFILKAELLKFLILRP